MRLHPKWQRPVAIYPPQRVKDSMGAAATVPGPPSAAVLHLQPGGGALMVQEYGLRAAHMLAGYAAPDIAVRTGDYVRVYAAEKPDYRVVKVQRWPGHCRIDLEEAVLYAGN